MKWLHKLFSFHICFDIKLVNKLNQSVLSFGYDVIARLKVIMELDGN